VTSVFHIDMPGKPRTLYHFCQTANLRDSPFLFQVSPASLIDIDDSGGFQRQNRNE
jgi:hypothetical protein